MDFHHTIPISLQGENIKENGFLITKKEHRELHGTQNIPYHVLRRYRNKVNGILIPNDYSLNLKLELWQRYFENAHIQVIEQVYSINKQIARYAELNNGAPLLKMDLMSGVVELVQQQKIYIKNIIG